MILFFLMWVLLKIDFDISWSVIAKCMKGPLMSTHSAIDWTITNTLWGCQENPGPEKEKSHITFCHQNLNGLMAYNFIKIIKLLQTLAVTNSYDIIYLTETFLDSSAENDDDWYPFQDIIFCTLTILVTREEVLVFITKTTFLL